MHGRGIFDGIELSLRLDGVLDAFVVFHADRLDPGHWQPSVFSCKFSVEQSLRVWLPGAFRSLRRKSAVLFVVTFPVTSCSRSLWLSGSKCDAEVFVNRLALVVVRRMRLPVRTGDSLRGFIGLESQVARFVLFCFLVVAEAVVAEHQIVMRLQIFGINGESFFEFGDSVGVPLFEEKDAAEFIVDDAVARELL